MESPSEIADALAELVRGKHDLVLFRSSRDNRLWVQVSRIDGEDRLLCEAVSDEYVGRHEQLTDRVHTRLADLGWGDAAGADYTRWEAGSTDEERAALAELVWRTLVEAYGQDASQPPSVEYP